MNSILENILKTKKFVNSKNEEISIHSHTNKMQCDFLQNIIATNKFSKSLEIGFAYGISTLAIIEEISKNGGSHFVIDPFQSDWGNNGIDLINQAGYSDKLEFHEEHCYEALSKLLFSERRFDFAYIDTTKVFDWILIDFFLIDKLLEINGIIVFDDAMWPGIKKVLRYISQLPHYKIHSVFPGNYRHSKIRKIKSLLKLLPYSSGFLQEEILVSDFDLGINTHCVALQKIDSDKRDMLWHVKF